ncbi:MAG: FumA C-terminus/TtdB family hydratase beta subunit [Bacillota bacterium]
MSISIQLPLTPHQARRLRAGSHVLLSGTVLTARDAAHNRLCAMLNAGEEIPIDLKNACIYYTGPCPAAPGEIIGPCGPTTSSRMDAYTPRFLEMGVTAMIGKGPRAPYVVDAMKKHGAVYFAATGGAGMLIASCVRDCRVVAFEDLGPEAIYALTVENLPLITAIDAEGNSMYAKSALGNCGE